MLKLIYWLFKSKFQAFAFLDQSAKKTGFEKTTRVHVDSKRKSYYGFSSDMDLPLVRLEALLPKLKLLKYGFDEEQEDKLWEALEAAINNGKKPDIAQIGFIAKERKTRKSMVINKDLMFDIIALRYIREDENPGLLDIEIHKEKIAQFKLDSKDGLYNFFYQAGLAELVPLLKTTESDFLESLMDSEVKNQALNLSLTAYLSGQS